ncbi:MAG: EamA family transporter [Bryobacteraceae bacterium]
MRWLLVAVIIASTVVGDVLQTFEMKRAGEVQEMGDLFSALARRKYLILAVAFMAVSFFAFLRLLSIADLSFAVPASAGTVVLETILAKLVLKEHVDVRRWAGVGLVACGVALLAL